MKNPYTSIPPLHTNPLIWGLKKYALISKRTQWKTDPAIQSDVLENMTDARWFNWGSWGSRASKLDVDVESVGPLLGDFSGRSLSLSSVLLFSESITGLRISSVSTGINSWQQTLTVFYQQQQYQYSQCSLTGQGGNKQQNRRLGFHFSAAATLIKQGYDTSI